MSAKITAREEIEKRFTADANNRSKVLPRPMAERAASQQLLRDIINGEVEKEVGIEFLIEQEMKYGHSREFARAHFAAVLNGEMRDWPPRESGYQRPL
jgi:hypothetical protein